MFYYPGIVVAPTAIINGTPLDCTICKKNTCTFMKDDEDFEEGSLDQTPPEKEQSAWWIKKYCTATSVDSFIMYFPFILLIMALMMVLIERGFIRFAYIYYIFLQYHLLDIFFFSIPKFISYHFQDFQSWYEVGCTLYFSGERGRATQQGC